MTKDAIHDSVKNALIKDGWTITADPFEMRYEEYNLFADLAAERTLAAERGDEKIIVEIKTFAGHSYIRELQQALGQYQIYLDIIELSHLEHTLYLAISEWVYGDFFTQKATQMVVERHRLRLLIVDVDAEEVARWID